MGLAALHMHKTVTRRMLLVLLAALAAVVVAVTAAAAPPACTHGVSSVGPAVFVNGHLANDQSDLTPHTEACLSH
jgi:hypothetical protein